MGLPGIEREEPEMNLGAKEMSKETERKHKVKDGGEIQRPGDIK